jgi:hypothetical protein
MRQKWIHKAWYDVLFILSPPFLCLLVILLFPKAFFANGEWTEVTQVWWIVLILGIDVTHVYSTLYRTYLDRETFKYYKSIYILIPVLVFTTNVLVYTISTHLFWSLLAYLAVFHFIRQQYGFFKIYSRGEKRNRWINWMDNISIYSLTLYPILYWHLSGPQLFNWMMPDDFFFFKWPGLLVFSTYIYFLWMVVYGVKEIYVSIKYRFLNIPKNLLWLGTACSWYVGIVYLKGDLTFTLLNVVAHGVPYMALIWIYGNKKSSEKKNKFLRVVFSPRGVVVFCLLIFFLGYLEEGLWDVWVWKDREALFSVFKFLPAIGSKELLSLVVALLATPQLTHYILDAFIWKMRNDQEGWQKHTLG